MHYEGMGQAAVEMMEPFDKVSKDNSAPFSLDSHALWLSSFRPLAWDTCHATYSTLIHLQYSTYIMLMWRWGSESLPPALAQKSHINA